MEDVTLNTLVLNAQNDPFLPGRHLPRQATSGRALRARDCRQHDGHAGFTSGGLPGRLRWLPERILNFFDGHV